MPRLTGRYGFSVIRAEPLELQRTGKLCEMYTLSPFVWREGNRFAVLIRAVPHSEMPAEKIARIYYGESTDGLRFAMGNEPVICPGPDSADKDGCEDPTVAVVGGTYYVYYTGWDEDAKRGQLLLATGRRPQYLQKRGIALPWTQNCHNPKEATIVPVNDGTWRLFFEYAAGGASLIGVAAAPDVAGPWRVLQPLFGTRAKRFDSWHLSTGPILTLPDGTPVMFYNGADRGAEWRIGWIAFDDRFTTVVARGEDPLLSPPQQRQPGDTDIVFAASCVQNHDQIWLYYSVADKDMFRATIRLIS